MLCRDFREIADSYLSNELLVETNHDVIRHLEACADCRTELTARRELRSKLREAFRHAPDLQPAGEFAGRLKAQLQDVGLNQSRFSVARAAYVAIAASVVIAALIGFKVLYKRWDTQNGNAAVVNAALSESAIGDHRDCALNHRLTERPINLDEAGRKYDPVYINLVTAVTSEGTLPPGVELVDKHSCVFKGRRFGHVILKYQGELVSVLVTRIDAQDRNTAAGAMEPISTVESEGYRLAYFETGHHAVYVVSGLSEVENRSIAQAIAPSVSKHIRDVEPRLMSDKL